MAGKDILSSTQRNHALISASRSCPDESREWLPAHHLTYVGPNIICSIESIKWPIKVGTGRVARVRLIDIKPCNIYGGEQVGVTGEVSCARRSLSLR